MYSETIGGEGTRPTILIHGGAWNIPEIEWRDHLDGLTEALATGRRMIAAGEPALAVVEAVIVSLEDHGAFDAGRGSVLTREGRVETDAGIMDGETMEFGSVACVHRIANPVRLARTVLEKGAGQFRILCGDAAEKFAREQDFVLVDNEELISPRERERYESLRDNKAFDTSDPFLRKPTGTVGCVVRDANGRIAAGTSTGGTALRRSGRIGDSPLPGAGFYADETGGASATGWGEAIAAVNLCGRAVRGVSTHGSSAASAVEALDFMNSKIKTRTGRGAAGGLILLPANGRGSWAFSTPRMARACWSDGEEMHFAVTSPDDFV